MRTTESHGETDVADPESLGGGTSDIILVPIEPPIWQGC
jgi:hypothetical protein